MIVINIQNGKQLNSGAYFRYCLNSYLSLTLKIVDLNVNLDK